MVYKPPDHLPAMHQLILASVHNQPGRFTRSELAKLLVGSKSARVSDYASLPDFGCLSDFNRKALTFEIDILLQQKYLALDRQAKVILGSMSDSTSDKDLPL